MTLTRTDLVLSLDQVGSADTAQVGQKVATLGELARAGLTVPAGMILTAEALALTLAAAGLDGAADPAQIRAVTLPVQVAAAIDTMAVQLGDRPLAVRSSGVAEDLPGASFAGQYESVLAVPAESLASAVRRCWASAFTGQVAAYRRSRGVRPDARMAVLVQPMVEAQAAGVAFTADPVTGDRDTALVSAVRGLGDRLASGEVSPDEWVIRGEAVTCRAAPEGAIDATVAADVAALARRIEARLGGPQDIEWALAGGRLVVLQARPMTALPEPAPAPVPVPAHAPPGFWEREASHAPRPWTQMCLSVFAGEVRNRAMRRTFAEFGLLADTLEFTQIGGWEYTRLVPLGGKDRPAPPAVLMPLLIRLVPRLRRRIADSVAAVRADKAGQFVERWYRQWQPDLTRRTTDLREADVSLLDDQELNAHTDRAAALLREGADIHFLLHGALMPILAELAFTCRDLLGWSDPQTCELLSGLSTTSTEPARRLAELADLARRRPAVRTLLGEPSDRTVGRRAESDPEFAREFAAYQRDFGCRAIRYEIADPSMAETPDLTLRLLADQLDHGYDPGAQAIEHLGRRAAAVDRAPTSPGRAATRRTASASNGRWAAPSARIRCARTTNSSPSAPRSRCCDTGRPGARPAPGRPRSDSTGATTSSSWTCWTTRRRRCGDGQPPEATVNRRRGERAYVEQHPGPATYGRNPGPPPTLEALPAEARSAMTAPAVVHRPGLRSRLVRPCPAGGHRVARRDRRLRPASYTGPVRVTTDESEFGKLRPGDVLVCPITSPAWSVLFPTVGALVTDTGGLLSHPAIIARE